MIHNLKDMQIHLTNIPWHYLGGVLSLVLMASCLIHVVLHKDDSRSAIGWLGVIMLVPILGSTLYLLFGINRIRRLAKHHTLPIPLEFKLLSTQLDTSEATHFAETYHSYQSLAVLGDNITKLSLLSGNSITPLVNGEVAYPAMLKAIAESRVSITLSTYIFDFDRVGKIFISALKDAQERGVEIRVLIDDIGLRYSFKTVLRDLKKYKIPVARFMGALRPHTFPHLNLRKHRKILVIDGSIAFTGGMNLREGHDLSLNPSHPVQDLHFQLEGPIITQLQRVFIDDWYFTTKEKLVGDKWINLKLDHKGESFARAIADGPDEDLNKLPSLIEGAISCAKTSIHILTPYFIPTESMMGSLMVAANKGVQVVIVTPEKNNLPFVKWASHHYLYQLLKNGIEIWFSPAPFDHSKLIVIDQKWSLFGSANLDPRSLRLNFELNVEAFDETLAQNLFKIVDQKLKNSKRITSQFFSSRSWIILFRDGIARLFSPYL
jgi:cardiolipin synthase A/B